MKIRYRIRTALLGTLCIALVTAAAVGGPLSTVATADQSDDEQTYAAIQGDQCIEIEPLGDGSQTVEEFYDYRTPETHNQSENQYSSYGTTHLQQDDTSIVTLYEGSDGLGLVLVHDRLDGDSAGGAATMAFAGLPAEGEWVVEDDTYSEDHFGGPFDEFTHRGTSSRMTWAWSEDRTDGAAFRGGLEDDFEITIDPAFNDTADFRQYGGYINDWQVISAANDAHIRTSLQSQAEPVTISPGGCPSLSVMTVMTSPSDPAPGDDVDVQATVTNDGSEPGTFTVGTTVEGEVIDEQELSLDPGETDRITVSTAFESEGSYQVAVENTNTSVVVEEKTSGDGTSGNGANGGENGDNENELPGFGVAAALLALLAVAVSAARRQAGDG